MKRGCRRNQEDLWIRDGYGMGTGDQAGVQTPSAGAGVQEKQDEETEPDQGRDEQNPAIKDEVRADSTMEGREDRK